MKKLPQERMNTSNLFPSPADGEKIWETPPTLSWILVDGVREYSAVLFDENGTQVWMGKTDKNYIVPDLILEPGKYSWNLFGDDMERGVQTFEIVKEAVRFPRPNAKKVLDSVPNVHPRHLFYAQDVEKIKAAHPREVETLKRNITLAISREMPKPPMYHRDPTALPMREYINYNRDYVDRDLVACALGWALLGDEAAASHAKNLLLDVCDRTPNGTSSVNGPWGDEVGLSCARCLPSVYDLMWTYLDERERIYVAHTVASFAQQCEDRLRDLNFCNNPGASHAGRIPAYMGEAALVLVDAKNTQIPRERLEKWLDYAFDIYGGIFPFFGGPDGGWAEGVFYSTSYTRWYLPFFCAVERFSGASFLSRPFYQRYTQYLLHFAAPKQEIHPFSDGYWCKTDDDEWPGFFAQNPCRLYAARFGPDLAKKRAYEAAAPEIFKLHLLDVFIPDGKTPTEHITGKLENTRVFPYEGLLSAHSDIENTENDIALFARASRFGSMSHQHPDNGSFALFSKGTALISPSGYYGRGYGTKHHQLWTRSSRAHNMIVVDGEGQASYSHKAVGKIVSCVDDGKIVTAILDLSDSYETLTKWTRELIFDKQGVLIVRDHVEADHEVGLDWCLHSLSRPTEDGVFVKLERNGERLEILPQKGLLPGCKIDDQFAVDLNEGEPKEYWVEMPQQFHMGWKTQKAKTHDVEVKLIING